MKFKYDSGFSMLELLIAVAIIGILAAIGIGNYTKIQARTRQSEAKASLSTLFVAETSFYGEYTQFTVDLKNLGFGVYGTRLRYMTGFYSGAGCTGYAAVNSAPVEVFTVSNTWSCGANVNAIANEKAVGWMLPTSIIMVTDQCTNDPNVLAGTTSSCDATSGSQAFTGIAVGDPGQNPGAAAIDGWSMTSTKNFSNTTSGIE